MTEYLEDKNLWKNFNSAIETKKDQTKKDWKQRKKATAKE